MTVIELIIAVLLVVAALLCAIIELLSPIRARVKCEQCGCEVTGEEAVPAPCPYAEEIHGDDTPRVLCERCREENYYDI